MHITKTKLGFGAVAMLGAGSLVTAGVLAVMQDPTNLSANNTFSTGQISLTIDKPTAVVSFNTNGGMMPGDAVTGSVLVTNASPAGAENQLRYATTVDNGSGDAALIAALNLTVRRADGNAGTSCAAFTGDILYGAADPLNPGSTTPRSLLGAGTISGTLHRLVGSPGQGPYDDGSSSAPFRDDRVLTAGAAETLCFRVALPVGTTETVQNMTTTTVFNFVAEQTVNNMTAEVVASY
jgi:hypothetical protein